MLQIYCDLDGVLVDFERGAVQFINEDLSNPHRVPEKFLGLLRNLQDALSALGRNHKIYISDLTRDPNKKFKEVRRYMYARLEDNDEFWENLSWEPDGAVLWEYISNMSPQIKILTAPMRAEGSRAGKIAWVRKNLGSKYEIILDEEKWNYASPGKLLIDDTLKNIEGWNHAGGETIHHIHAIDTIEKLKMNGL